MKSAIRAGLILVLVLGTAPAAELAAADATGPAVGSAAPTFTLANSEGKNTSLSDFKGKWVVLYFYPKDFTGG
jgi:thioredoxin-dependent peroxiredoxin